MSPVASAEVMCTLGNPPLPSTIWAMPGIPKRGLKSAMTLETFMR
jgi:hypothetical protein